MKISVPLLMMVIISGISLIEINQVFGFGCIAVGGNWNDPNTWINCGDGVPDDTGDGAGITSVDVQLNNEFTISFLEIAEGGSLSVNGKLTTGNLGITGDSTLFINCNGELVLTERGSNDGRLTNHGIFRTLLQVPFSNNFIYQSSGTDIFGGPFTGDAIVPIASICPVCGDGIEDPLEECDDSNNNDLDGCDAFCVIEFCGDGLLNDLQNEECDDGNVIEDDGCSATCQIEFCGDGMVDLGEECDDMNNLNTDACLNTCKDATCGDTFVWQGVEDCEPPNTQTCDAFCKEIVSICPNGIIEPPETCDPPDGITCDAQCMLIFVGGEFLGVDSTALLMAGFQANALWLIPAIVAVVGIGIVIARKF